jgi:hypothetical protein
LALFLARRAVRALARTAAALALAPAHQAPWAHVARTCADTHVARARLVPTQASSSQQRRLADRATSLLTGHDRETKEEDVLKEIEILKTLDQCARPCSERARN